MSAVLAKVDTLSICKICKKDMRVSLSIGDIEDWYKQIFPFLLT
jgi:hypothetical protein